ncbi:MAG TPA: hypothetical protein VGJ26_16175 [Pirellulales bacterium]
MQFKYRYVGFGTVFNPTTGARQEAISDPDFLYENELAVDVGGICLDCPDGVANVVDHHFFRSSGQFPSATAAVLHHAHRVHERMANHDLIWLVTHKLPDFDAFAAMYLVRCILEGKLPHCDWPHCGLRNDGWFQDRKEINWFAPFTAHAPPDRRWAILLASYAAHVDNCRRLSCPKHRSLHGVLYAALVRGRDYLSESSGALPFFNEVKDRLTGEHQAHSRTSHADHQQLNPLFDSILEQSEVFAPELRMLDNELIAYERDVSRARKAVVYVRKSPEAFEEWFPEYQRTALLDMAATVIPKHIELPGHSAQAVDGIYLRDPECLLFKEWARTDIENSSLRRGFLFTAVAYSGERAGAVVNQTNYYFSLDPEQAGRLHLYDVWARLQAAEVFESARSAYPPDAPTESGTMPRLGYEQRANQFVTEFHDPWFDGNNYRCAIVVAPNRGTRIGPAGSAADLSDDPIAALVRSQLELSVFTSRIEIIDFPAAADQSDERNTNCAVTALMDNSCPAPQGFYRSASIRLNPAIDLLAGRVAEQIGGMLWRLIDPDHAQGLPTDFASRHLRVETDSVSVWSRRGIVTAYRPVVEQQVIHRRELMRDIANGAHDILKLSQRKNTSESQEGILEKGSNLMRQMVAIQFKLALPNGRLLQQFFEANGLVRCLDTLHEINRTSYAQELTKKVGENLAHVTATQKVVHLIEFILVAYYVAGMWEHFYGESSTKEVNESVHYHWGFLVAALCGVVVVEILNAIVGAPVIIPFLRRTYHRVRAAWARMSADAPSGASRSLADRKKGH